MIYSIGPAPSVGWDDYTTAGEEHCSYTVFDEKTGKQGKGYHYILWYRCEMKTFHVEKDGAVWMEKGIKAEKNKQKQEKNPLFQNVRTHWFHWGVIVFKKVGGM